MAFKTLQTGINSLVAGDILEVRSGVYAEQITDISWANTGSSWSNPIILRGYAGDARPVVRPGPHRGHTWLFERENLKYLLISGLEIDGCNNTFSEGTVFNTWSGAIRLENCVIRNAPRDGIGARTWENTPWAIATDIQIRNNHITHCGLKSEVREDSKGSGIYIEFHDSVVENNLIEDCVSGIISHGGKISPTQCSNVIIRNNRILRGGTATSFQNPTTKYGTGITLAHGKKRVYNNVIFRFPDTNGLSACIWVWDHSDGTEIDNNTCVGSTTGVILGNSWGSGHHVINTKLRNNIWSAVAMGIKDLSGGGTEASHNLTNPPQSTIFINHRKGDFRLRAGSPAINNGMTLPFVKNDVVGTPRPQGGAYDIGAYEYVSSSKRHRQKGKSLHPNLVRTSK
ncbi:MAG TPA: right-handed parallel beta-helix repeat-containing protein [Chthonomonadales bacterium]|nr:right-handed parallel beta-helix repeat-containing protein [Chthonomonadales bacterium]